MFARFKTCMGDVCLSDVLSDIRTGVYASSVNRIRGYMDKGNPEAADKLKKALPAITISATYRKKRLANDMSGYNPLVILDMDELSGQSRMEVNRLKAMITKDAVRERRPYARNAEVYDRRASFAATVNDNQILADRTGSRRFLCFEATQIDYTSAVDYAAVYAQALALFRDGFRYWFADTDIAEVNDNNESFQQTSPEVELFYTYFGKPERFELPLLLSSSEIVAKIAEKTRLPLTNISVNMVGKMLKRDGFVCQKKHGKWLYSVIEFSFDQVEARRKGF